MMSHGQKNSFTPVRNEPLTGRNANIQTTMFKRKQIFERVSTERFQTPFSGYSFTGSSVTDNSYLARSQVSQFSQQNVIRLIRQELQKNGLNGMSQTSEQSLKNKKQLNILRIQIRSIKQSYLQLNKQFKRKLQQQNVTINELRKQSNCQNKNQAMYREEMSGQLVQKIKQVEQDIAIKMRLIFSKMQEDLRKQLTNYANRQFVPTSFLDDLDKQLNELDDRIANIQTEHESTKISGHKQNLNTSKIDKDSSMILSSGSELKLKQIQRDLINLKKELDEKSQKIRDLDESISTKHQNYAKEIKQAKQNLIQLNNTLKDIKRETQSLQQSLETKVQSYRKYMLERIQAQIQTVNKKIEQEGYLKSQNLSNTNLSNTDQPESFMKKLQSTSILIQNTQVLSQSLKYQDTRQTSKLSLLQSNIKESKQSPKKAKKITITYGATQKVTTPSLRTDPLVQGVNEQIGSVTACSTTSQSKDAKNENKQANEIKQTKQQQQIKGLYKVDKQGYLMDSKNKYILSPSSSMIFIPQHQIIVMEKANLIKIQRWIDKTSADN